MLAKGIFHPELLKTLGELRHMDNLIIGDAGLPVPNGVKRIDLGWRQNDPRFLDVLQEILKVLIVEKAVFAEEALEISPDFNKRTINLLPEDVPIQYIAHSDLKEATKDAKAVILTGEFTPYTNVILTCGCAY